MKPAQVRLLVTLALSTCGLACHAHNLGRDAPCDSSDACAVGLTCAAGACRAPCNLTTECPPTTACTGGLCIPNKQTCTASACTTPPVCHDPAAQCINDTCVYGLVPDGTTCSQGTTPGVCSNGQCIDCLTSADCDPRDFGHDLCFTGTCAALHCTFAPVVGCTRTNLGTSCGDGSTCKSGYCVSNHCCESACDGICEDCGGNGRCNVVAADDQRCGTIDCDALDTVCRDFNDYTGASGQRCKSFGACRTPNSADCQLFDNAPTYVLCRDVAYPCDAQENCSNGACPADASLPAGDSCVTQPKGDTGVCDNSGSCFELVSTTAGMRYFIEETSSAANRSDALGNLDLTATGGSVSTVSLATGRGVRWNSTTSSPTYCSAVGTGFALDQATFETVVTIADADVMTNSMILRLAANGEVVALLASRSGAAGSGQVSFTGIFGNLTFSWQATISARAVVHLVVDGTQGTPQQRLQLYVNGVLASNQSGSVPASPATSVSVLATDTLCLGNDSVADGAFVGIIFYAALYTQVLDATAISHAAGHLRVTDAY